MCLGVLSLSILYTGWVGIGIWTVQSQGLAERHDQFLQPASLFVRVFCVGDHGLTGVHAGSVC